jgi:hypothetical protein
MITTMAEVKTLARLFNKSGSGAPTTATVGVLGDVYMDTDDGLTYELTAIATTPSVSYTWTADTELDAEITMNISRAESDYLRIRGIPFELDDDEIVYPTSANYVAAEMVCYLSGIGRLGGRGKQIESLGGRSSNYEQKILGYPISIVGTIERYQSLV